MEMTKGEICLRFQRNGGGRKQIGILADLNGVSAEEIKAILIEGGVLEPGRSTAKKQTKGQQASPAQTEEPGQQEKLHQRKRVRIPESIAAVLFARIDALDAEITDLERQKAAKEQEYKEITEFISEFGEEQG